MSIKPLRVSEVNQYIKRTFAGDPILSNISVEGEVSNFKHHYSGHMYFSLKDDKGKIKCVMFKNDNSSISMELKDGMKVVVKGYISVFERNGNYQLYVKSIKKEGLGELYIAFEKLKTKLEQEGLFDEEYKKTIPCFPKKIGIVTSSTGAAIRDIITVIKRRFPIVELIIYPVLVQGESAPLEISRGLKYFDSRDDIDLIITGRGGGSIEELFAFNDEGLARTIYAMGKPVISAVGHETDYTISDFVADLRAPTPSAAAELAVPELNFMKKELKDNFLNLVDSFNYIKDNKLKEIGYQKNKLNYNNPISKLNDDKQYLDTLFKKLITVYNFKVSELHSKVDKLGDKLNILSPLSSINRGYGLVLDNKGHVIKTVNDIKEEEKLSILLKGGIVESKVVKVNKGEFKNGFN
ncbi:MAG: exodeoxyribonuclease VII large subunit [Clostridiaceae bacterium]|nr:exodeoxyribonuclease VII large subunit [Clostridiaceae bacterium]MBW4859877.1 exodeoxyribonuclease VII large subunit [Clostridiaceae bacterium]MBW4869693.1 exodeoxyribonuclease VII large subunit [Clostridiaceae bacterium]